MTPAPCPLLAGTFATPAGPACVLATADGALAGLYFLGSRPADEVAARAARGAPLRWAPDAEALALFSGVRAQVDDYFAGRRRDFDLPLALRGTPFQLRVWAELQRIPWGETVTYAGLAGRIERPAAIRAVGRANATNPVSLVVPCHRVVGSDGALTGYGGGIDIKQLLLELEGARPRSR
jgi:methylated-DNA-[protein]-cysteine S-methyltransferase